MAERRRSPATTGKTTGTAKSGGRPAGLKPEVETRILNAVRAGASMGEAATVAGISRRSLHRWIARGEGHDADPRFRSSPTRSRAPRAEAKVGAVAQIRRAMGDDWRAAAFYLERTDPANWGRRTALEHSGPDGAPITVRHDLSRLSDEELAELQRLTEKIGPAGA
jgi:hypothetical protein